MQLISKTTKILAEPVEGWAFENVTTIAHFANSLILNESYNNCPFWFSKLQ